MFEIWALLILMSTKSLIILFYYYLDKNRLHYNVQIYIHLHAAWSLRHLLYLKILNFRQIANTFSRNYLKTLLGYFFKFILALSLNIEKLRL